jgi:hypothetical protein
MLWFGSITSLPTPTIKVITYVTVILSEAKNLIPFFGQ